MAARWQTRIEPNSLDEVAGRCVHWRVLRSGAVHRRAGFVSGVGVVRYFTARSSIASEIKSPAVRSVSVTTRRSFFHFSRVTVTETVFIPMRSGRVMRHLAAAMA